MDRLECGQCKEVFTKLDLFIEHKQLGCTNDSLKLEEIAEEEEIDDPNSNDASQKIQQVVKGNQLPFKFRDISSFLVKKQIVKQIKKSDDPDERIRRLKERIQEALPPGYCGKCSACLTKADCKECASCLPHEGEASTSKPREQCLMRICETLTINNEYQVEKLLDKKMENDEPYYLVKWKGYPNSANTWEPASNIISKNLIKDFEDSNDSSVLKRKHLDEISNDTDPKRLKTNIMGSLGLNEISTATIPENSSKISKANSVPPGEVISTKLDSAEDIDQDKEKNENILDEFLTFEKPPVNENLCSEMEGILKELAEDNMPSIETPLEIPLPRNARKSIRGEVPNISRRQLEKILSELQSDAKKTRNPSVSGSEIDETIDNSSNDGKRLGRSTKKAALDFIRSVCKPGMVKRTEVEDSRSFPAPLRMKTQQGLSSIYIRDPSNSNKMILVKGYEEQISHLQGANLNPIVMVESKEPLRKAAPVMSLEELEKQEEFLKNLLENKDEDPYGISDPDEYNDPGDDGIYYSDNYGNQDLEFDSESPDSTKLKKKAGRPPKPESAKRPIDNSAKRARGRPKKDENTAKCGNEIAAGKLMDVEILEPGARRKKGKSTKYSEYIDPDTVVGDDNEDSKDKSEVSSLNFEDDDFEPPSNLKGPSGRPRGRPIKPLNINDITNDKDLNQKFKKGQAPSKSELSAKATKGKKNRVFVVMPDGTMVEVSGTDKDQAIKKATAKMDQRQAGASKKNDGDDGKKATQAKQRDKNMDLRPPLEECTNDASDDVNTLKLPNTVQLVESELPLTQAENAQSLVGMYLFRQIYSPNDAELFCKLCKGKVTLRYPADLEKHYQVIHEIAVQIFKAEFSENIVFVCVPSDVSETTVLNSGCRFCDITLRTLSEVRDHYPTCHTKDVRLIPENAVIELGDRFYCSVCSNASADFLTHHQHMKDQHSMQTYICKCCNFCTPKPNRLRTHYKQRHLQEQPGPHLQCSVCSVYVHGRERLNKHILLSHAVQTGSKTWSCAKCLKPCGDAKDLMLHIPSCPYVRRQGLEELTGDEDKDTSNAYKDVKIVVNQSASLTGSTVSNIYYKCTICTLTFTSEADIRKHMIEGIHINSNEISILPVSLEENPENTCYLCSLKFHSNDLLMLHFHHVHMRWVAKGAVDYTADELENSPQELAQELAFIADTEKKNALESTEKETATEEQEIIRQLENELDGITKDETPNSFGKPEETQLPIGPDITVKIKSSNPIKMSDLPTETKLVEIGFPTKVGHYCHLCDTVIKSYALFYLHMHNLHGLEKRFQCIISSCSHTFKSSVAFKNHSQYHNQKSEHFCSMCDLVYGTGEDLEDHHMSHDHASKYMRVQEKYNRSEPRNYRCKVCHCWYGLFATFVKHMETETHQYKCQHCGLTFVQPGPRRNHIQSVHPDMSNICEICGVRLQNGQALWSHLSLHNMVYECEKCHRRFLQKEQLTAHMEIHAPPTPCPWEGCNRRLSTKVGLYNHLRMHKGDADFTCNTCNKGFFKKKTLDIHMKSHEKNATQKNTKGQSITPAMQSVETGLSVGDEISQEQTVPSIELIQFICAGCLNGFDSEERFAAHECTGQATQEQVDAAASVLSQEQILNEAADNSQENHHHHVITDEDLAAQLAQAVAEATTQGQVTFTSSQNVTMSDGTVVTMTTMDSEGTILPSNVQSLVDNGGGTVLASADSSGNITFIRTAEDDTEASELVEFVNEAENQNQLEAVNVEHQQLQDGESQQEMEYQEEHPNDEREADIDENYERVSEEPADDLTNVEPGEDESQHQTIYLTEEEALLAAQSGQLHQNSEGTFIMHSGEGHEANEDGSIVMMVEGGEEGNEHQIMEGNQPYSIVKVPTEDGGEQVLLIPLNSDGENQVITLPPNVMLREGENAIEGSSITYQEHNVENGEQQQTFLTLPEGTDVRELLERQQGSGLDPQLENVLMNAVNN